MFMKTSHIATRPSANHFRSRLLHQRLSVHIAFFGIAVVMSGCSDGWTRKVVGGTQATFTANTRAQTTLKVDNWFATEDGRIFLKSLLNEHETHVKKRISDQNLGKSALEVLIENHPQCVHSIAAAPLAEVQPDVIVTNIIKLAFELQKNPGGAAGLDLSIAESVEKIGRQSIAGTILRDALYRLNEARLLRPYTQEEQSAFSKVVELAKDIAFAEIHERSKRQMIEIVPAGARITAKEIDRAIPKEISAAKVLLWTPDMNTMNSREDTTKTPWYHDYPRHESGKDDDEKWQLAMTQMNQPKDYASMALAALEQSAQDARLRWSADPAKELKRHFPSLDFLHYAFHHAIFARFGGGNVTGISLYTNISSGTSRLKTGLTWSIEIANRETMIKVITLYSKVFVQGEGKKFWIEVEPLTYYSSQTEKGE